MEDITGCEGAEFLTDDASPGKVPAVTSHGDVADAYLVPLAKAHKLKLATLDEVLCGKPWSKGVAENPLSSALP